MPTETVTPSSQAPTAPVASTETKTGATPEPSLDQMEKEINDSASASTTSQKTESPVTPGSTETPAAPSAVKAPSTSDDVSMLRKSYDELRMKLSEQGREKNEYKKQLEQINNQLSQFGSAISKLTEAPFDPEQWMENLRTGGPDFVAKALEKHFTTTKSALEQQIQSEKASREAQEDRLALLERRADTDRYPDFKKLEADMVRLYQDLQEKNALPFDPSKLSGGEVLDKLYELVKASKATEAVAAARTMGREEAERELAREAASGVPSGGKKVGSSPFDPNKLSLDELEKVINERAE
jgi:hypothetical protein